MTAYELKSHAGSAPTAVLSGNINSSDLSFSVDNASGYPDGTHGPFVVMLDAGQSVEEKVLCDSRSGNTFTVNALGRGYDSTTPHSHSGGTCTVNHTWSGVEADEVSQAVHQTLGQIAAKGDLLSGTGANALAVTSVGTDGLAFVADSTKPGGVKWHAPMPDVHDHSGTGQGGNVPESSITNLLPDLAARLQLAGGTMTGPLVLAADPTAALGAATKQYADAVTATEAAARAAAVTAEANARAVAVGATLPLAGGTLTGDLVLAGAPATSLSATTKAYVDPKFTPVDVQKTTSTASITSTAVSVASAGAITFDGSTKVKITCGWDSFIGTVDGDLFTIGIFEGAALVRGIEMRGKWATDSLLWGGEASVVITPTAAAHTYELKAIRSSGSGSGTVGAAATSPAFIRVEQFR